MPTSRIVIYITIAVLVSYDFVCVFLKWPTISNQMTAWNAKAGDLPMWLLAALWMHFYFPRLMELLRGH
jgi:hypothetical protein